MLLAVFIYLCVFCFPLPGYWQRDPNDQRRLGKFGLTERTEFQVVTPDGRDVPFRLIELQKRGGKTVLHQCEGSQCRNLDIDRYSYRVTLEHSGEQIAGSVVIAYSEQLITIVSPTYGEGTALRGIVRGNRVGDQLWIHAREVLGDFERSGRVQKDGSFLLPGMIRGRYSVVLVRNGTIVHELFFSCCRVLQRGAPAIEIQLSN